jgi:hypothetical protein
MMGGERIGTVTDMDGKFVIKPINSGSYNLTISYVGMDTIIRPITVKPNMATIENDIILSNGLTLGAAIVEAPREKMINPEETSVKTITYKDIKNNPNLRSMNKLIQSTNSDYIVSENGKDAYVRGSRSDASVYFLDGVKMSTIGNVPGVSIGSVTVYTGGETKSYFDMYNEWYYSQER